MYAVVWTEMEDAKLEIRPQKHPTHTPYTHTHTQTQGLAFAIYRTMLQAKVFAKITAKCVCF